MLRRTLTWDRGSEMAEHLTIADALDLDIYFCDPASPWQRGSNQNTNGLLRQYFRLVLGSAMLWSGQLPVACR
jgi:transposase, IS30 family